MKTEPLEKLAIWAGVRPGDYESAGKRKSGKSRRGSPYLWRILCKAAQAASQSRCGLVEKFRALLVRRGRKRAIFALAHKPLKTVFVLIDRRDYYRNASIDTLAPAPLVPVAASALTWFAAWRLPRRVGGGLTGAWSGAEASGYGHAPPG